MGKHKTPHLNARNWRNLEDDVADIEEPAFEKLRRHKLAADAERKKSGAKPRDSFTRERLEDQAD